MTEWQIPTDIWYVVTGYVVALSGTIAWLLLSNQSILAKEAHNVIGIALRMALVCAAGYAFCWAMGIAIWFVAAAVLLILGLGVCLDLPVSGVFSFALLYLIQQFVLGFPARHEWVLSPDVSVNEESVLAEKNAEQVGKAGVTISPLRPVGEVQIGAQTFQARAYNGLLIERDEAVDVVGARNGTLVVRLTRERREEID